MHVDLHPERKHFEILESEEAVPVVVAYVEDAQMPEVEREILGVPGLHDLADGEVAASAVLPEPLELFLNVLSDAQADLVLILTITHSLNCNIIITVDPVPESPRTATQLPAAPQPPILGSSGQK